MPREIKDATLKASAALPNAGNTVNANTLDLGAVTPFPVTEQIGIKITTTDGNGSNSKNINIRLLDSADNSTFTNIALAPNPALRVTDNANAGFAASNVVLALPHNTRRYIRASAVGEANGGDASNGTFTVELVF